MTTNAISTSPPPIGYHRETFECGRCGGQFDEFVSGAFRALGQRLSPMCDRCSELMELQFRKQQLADEQATRMADLLRSGLVPPVFQANTWAASDSQIEAFNHSAWSQARAWFRNTTKNLFVCGGVGTGKTTLARCCLNQAFAAGYSVGEVSARRLAKTSDLFNEGNGAFASWKQVQYLLIDDVDKATWNTERLGAFWELLDTRLSGRRRTIVTSNLPMGALVTVLRAATPTNSSLAEASLDRLKPCLSLELTGQSQRPRE